MTWKGKSGKSAAGPNDFAVYISNNVLSHIFVTLKTEFQVPTTRVALPIYDSVAMARHVLCRLANGPRCICV